MRILFALILLLGSWLTAMGAPAVTIENALKLIPKEQAKNLVRIEAREGNPLPERWYIQVYDPDSENGLHEYVVSGREIVASRSLSQFLTGAKPEDVVGARLVKVDSDDLLKLVEQYVEANHLNVTKINYTMFREAINPAPVWKMTCFDESDKQVGELVVNARNANVVSHDGFALVPGQSGAAAKSSATPATAQGQSTARSAAPPRAVAVKGTPSPAAGAATPQKHAPLFQRMFGGKKNDQPTPAPNH